MLNIKVMKTCFSLIIAKIGKIFLESFFSYELYKNSHRKIFRLFEINGISPKTILDEIYLFNYLKTLNK